MKTSLNQSLILYCGLIIVTQLSVAHSQHSYHHHAKQEYYSSTGYTLGSLSAKWESGDRGPATISTSILDPGGMSYGTYQISAKHGHVADYLKHEGSQFCDFFEDIVPGTIEFNKQWKTVASAYSTEFHQAEHTFIKRTHYIPFVARLYKYLQFDVRDYSPVIRDVIWSTAVQHGPNSQVVINALQSDLIYQLTEYEIINKIYTERSRKKNDKLYYFPRIKDHWQNHITNRFDEERMEALSQLKKYNVNTATNKHNSQSVFSNPNIQSKTKQEQSKPNIADHQTKTIIDQQRHNSTFRDHTRQDTRYRISIMTLDTPHYPFDDLNPGTVYTEWDERIGFYHYFIGRQLNQDVAEKLLNMLKSKGYSIGKIVPHK